MSDPGRMILALPSKGRLNEMALGFLKGCGFDVRRIGNGRDYWSTLTGIDNVDVIYFRPEEIPARIDAGDVHIGITGEDLFREYGEGEPSSTLVMPALGFGAARLVIAVPQSWVDVSTLDDLSEAAMLFHQRNGRSLRVATKFAKLTRAFLAEHGIVEYALVGSLGATEGAPAAGVADFIVDLTSTGTTLLENHLKEVEGGTVLATQACLSASLRPGLWTEGALAALQHLVAQIEARGRATSTLTVRATLPSRNMGKARADIEAWGCSVTSWLPGQRVDEETTRDLVALCPRAKVYWVAKLLRDAEANDVIVGGSEFVFSDAPSAFDAFKTRVAGLHLG